MHQKNASLQEALDAAIRSNRMEGITLSPEALAMIERVKIGEITLQELEKATVIKYAAIAKGKALSYEDALKIARR